MSDGNFFRKIIVIMRKELLVYFTTPIAYIVFGIFLLAAGFYFFVFSPFFLFGQAEMREFFASLPVLFAIAVPAVTMRLFSEEKQSGSIEILLTLPIQSYEAVTGKFLAATVFVCAMLVPTLVYVLSVAILGSLDFGPVLGGYFGAALLAAAFSAIGVFSSSISRNQIIAFLIGVAICITLTLIEYILFFLPAAMVRFFSYFSLIYHFKNFARGIIDSRDIIFFLSVIAVSILGTITIIEERR